MRNPKFSHAFEVVPQFPEALQPLKELAMNYRWTWHHPTQDLFRSIDKELWDSSDHNPISFLYSIPKERLEKLVADQFFLDRLRAAGQELKDYLSQPTWFDQQFPGMREGNTIAYFCAEFGISEGLPIYSGGLGVLAGDHLKAASDLGIPLVGVGLLYARGYFRQQLTHDGWQQEIYPQYDFYQMPLQLQRGSDDQPLRVEVEFPDRVVTCQVWRADVGRVPLYLLDSNVLENLPTDQGITDTLYGGDEEMRIRQEMILGIGGIRALKAAGVEPTVCHMNEGHAAFLSIERIRQFMIDHGCDFKTARQVVVAGNVFTTHTPVPAGFDLFTRELLERYMGRTVAQTGLDFKSFLELGRIEKENEGEAFNMAVLAMENADHVNGVAKLHAKVTREMFHGRWPDYPVEEVPIEAITNGIHTMTWISERFSDLFDEYLGEGWRRHPERRESWERVWEIPDHELWAAKENQRGELVRFIRRRLQRDLRRRNSTHPDFQTIGAILDPRILTIGFARRFATYKRATLMLTDRERLLALLNHPERPVQIVIAGKSHPRDDGGKRLIQELVNFINNSGARNRMVFLEDYDMEVGRAMVQGVDVWLNNPRRPMEASGTSGMKVVPNGALNCSVLDGWWDEAYNPGVGFAIGERGDYPDQLHQDWLDSRSLYGLIESEIAPKFYHRPDSGLPTGWLQMVKRSIFELAPQFSTGRMVSDYTGKFYVPAATSYQKLRADGLKRAREILEWRGRVKATWGEVRILEVHDDSKVRARVGDNFGVTAKVSLGTLTPADVRVQAVSGKIGPNRELVETQVHEMTHQGDENGAHTFAGHVPCDRPGLRGYTVRVVPHQEDINVKSELNLVRWE